MSRLIEIQNLKKYFKTGRGMVHAVDDVSFSIEQGRTMGIVGESGCGKSTLGRMLVHLEESTGGQIIFNDEDVTQLGKNDMKKFREHAQIIFQDPYSSLDPRYTVEDSIKESLLISGKYNRTQALEKTQDLMELVGIAPRLRLSYPHELDGGRRQRVGIARALALDPEFIVCDEPVSALDVSIQAQILNLLKKLQQEHNLTYMFITHDLSVVKHISDDICVMYLGQLVETCSSHELFEKQFHPYTKALLSAIPSVDIRHKMNRIVLKGEITSPIDPKPGCRFAARCSYACEKCHQPQKLEEISPNHFVSCCRAKEING
ncbi:ATP-binding cassette domain-containing protein [Clostridium sp. AF19-22AC]|jgi:oligopeptide/dipeptide ABC transporter ATP-binding protein|uniref:Peptide/nickel transport system ATP-binding protein n=1 Tax=Faecalicatena orotica TaxID=1544 RepID=A0A2Y9BII1_9FIRM|nr:MULTISPECIES: oligopeptide/dipeptide ABC transporter ATP-binding protein [Clostridia]PWJ29780.1 peptide/nickel transport system ATP-binding protein [Faecalicatena orotica]RHR30227.1 ATP-binding cassette domain-containing protein [Clostridium sp. AF19-22AC]SSA55504.1 peptide/nickel transport system ATP-binding protein [Faecalicatena orotica]